MEKQPTRTSEEIDLLYYIQQIREGIIKLGEIGKAYLRLLWRNKILFFAIVLLISGAAYSLRFFIPPAYRTGGIFVSHYLPANYYGIMIEDLDQLVHEKNLPALAEQLQLTPDVVSKISRIEFIAFRDAALERNDTVLAPFQINLVLKQMDQVRA